MVWKDSESSSQERFTFVGTELLCTTSSIWPHFCTLRSPRKFSLNSSEFSLNPQLLSSCWWGKGFWDMEVKTGFVWLGVENPPFSISLFCATAVILLRDGGSWKQFSQKKKKNRLSKGYLIGFSLGESSGNSFWEADAATSLSHLCTAEVEDL